jgi:hypothetical protein
VYPARVLTELPIRRGGFVLETEVLVEAAAHGWDVVEVGVTVIPRAARRSRFRPVADGVAIGAYLAGPVLRRWRTEMAAAAAEGAALFDRRRRRARHGALLEAGGGYAGSPAWGLAVGGAAFQRAVHRLGAWWSHPRRRRATSAACATLAGPVVLGCAVVQALGGRLAPDLVTPLVARIYGPDRLHPAGARSARPLTVPGDDGVIGVPRAEAL